MTPSNGDQAQRGDDERDGETKKSGGAGFPLFNRSRSMGSSGLQAASIGWVLAGCVFFGYFAGTWLDGHFKTQFWMPILVLVGIAAGFREMFVTLGQLQKSQENEKTKARRENAERAKTQNTTSALRFNDADDGPKGADKLVGPQRLFHVPAPPTASFEARPDAQKEQSRSMRDAEVARQETLDAEAVLRALQGQDESDGEQSAREL